MGEITVVTKYILFPTILIILDLFTFLGLGVMIAFVNFEASVSIFITLILFGFSSNISWKKTSLYSTDLIFNIEFFTFPKFWKSDFHGAGARVTSASKDCQARGEAFEVVNTLMVTST